MKASELIKELQEYILKNGDFPVCFTEHDDYWGMLYNEINSLSVHLNGQPKGPKSGESEPCIVLA